MNKVNRTLLNLKKDRPGVEIYSTGTYYFNLINIVSQHFLLKLYFSEWNVQYGIKQSTHAACLLFLCFQWKIFDFVTCGKIRKMTHLKNIS